ncbi:MAG: hypothetical protein HKP40_07505 [Litoreibacter sp.]|nr:hypothetical protein [Litoreibacter sp.]
MKAWLVLIAALAFGVAPFITEGFAGFRPDQFPIPQDDAPVQPAGYAFSIWSVIYLWLLLHAVLGAFKFAKSPGWEATRLPMIVSLSIGAVWIKVATLSVIWATVLIWAMLLSALWALFAARNANPGWALRLPVGLYAGWLTAASFVALGLVGAGYGLGSGPGLGQVGWAFLALTGALAVTLIVLSRTRVWTYGFAAAWGFAGIIVQNLGSSPGVAIAAVAATLLVAGSVLKQLRR